MKVTLKFSWNRSHSKYGQCNIDSSAY